MNSKSCFCNHIEVSTMFQQGQSTILHYTGDSSLVSISVKTLRTLAGKVPIALPARQTHSHVLFERILAEHLDPVLDGQLVEQDKESIYAASFGIGVHR